MWNTYPWLRRRRRRSGSRWHTSPAVRDGCSPSCTRLLSHQASPCWSTGTSQTTLLLSSPPCHGGCRRCSPGLSLVGAVRSYAELFLPRAPVGVDDKLLLIGVWAGGLLLCGVVAGVLAAGVRDSRVLAGCTGVVAAVMAGLVALWVWLARKYGGDGELSDEPARLPI
ncbi:hypothetical protein ACP4OV_017290 [Aristida adscensionis]